MGKHHITRVTALFVIIWADISKATFTFTFSLQMLFCHINMLANTVGLWIGTGFTIQFNYDHHTNDSIQFNNTVISNL